MAFTTRSKKELAAPLEEVVGPGSYNLAGQAKRAKLNLVPFGSSTSRSKDSPRPEGAPPGPGQYKGEPATAINPNASCKSAFESHTVRFQPVTSPNPGPGAYRTDQAWVSQQSKAEQYQSMVARRAERLQWIPVAQVPSIPARHQSYGYEEAESGELRLHVAEAHNALGSLVTEASSSEGQAVLPHHMVAGPGWARSRSHRWQPGDDAHEVTPGPGTYAHLTSWKKDHASSAFASKTKRLAGSASEAPGPGAYVEAAHTSMQKKAASTVQSFGSTSARLAHSAPAVVPGPGAYGKRSPLEQHVLLAAKADKDASAPFSSTSARFEDGEQALHPGPGAYQLRTDMLLDLERQRFGRNASFSVTARRFPPPPAPVYNPPARAAPAAGSAVTAETGMAAAAPFSAYSQPSAVFSSRTARFHGAAGSGPAPGSYDVIPQPIGKKGRPMRRTEPRFSEKQTETVPGPGAYAAEGDTRRRLKGAARTSEVRFALNKPAGEARPGPGQYDIAQSSLLKPSFNITIGPDWSVPA